MSVYSNDQFSPTHIALYMALFQFWNQHRFPASFTVARADLMQLAKIKSKTTYSKGLGDLEGWRYIMYQRSNNPLAKSRFTLINIWSPLWPNAQGAIKYTSPKNGRQVGISSPVNRLADQSTDTANGLALVPLNKTYKHKPKNVKSPPNAKSVIEFFLEQGSKENEGLKFWNHYESLGWKSGNTKIQNWKAAANKWLIGNRQKIKQSDDQNMDHLHTTKNKDYGKPL